jgi:hypothetical protein
MKRENHRQPSVSYHHIGYLFKRHGIFSPSHFSPFLIFVLFSHLHPRTERKKKKRRRRKRLQVQPNFSFCQRSTNTQKNEMRQACVAYETGIDGCCPLPFLPRHFLSSSARRSGQTGDERKARTWRIPEIPIHPIHTPILGPKPHFHYRTVATQEGRHWGPEELVTEKLGITGVGVFEKKKKKKKT